MWLSFWDWQSSCYNLYVFACPAFIMLYSFISFISKLKQGYGIRVIAGSQYALTIFQKIMAARDGHLGWW